MTKTNNVKETGLIFNEIASSQGASEGSRIYTCCDIATGQTEIIIEKTIIERFDIKDYHKCMDLYERLNCGGGRKMFKLEELAHPYNPK